MEKTKASINFGSVQASHSDSTIAVMSRRRVVKPGHAVDPGVHVAAVEGGEAEDLSKDVMERRPFSDAPRIELHQVHIATFRDIHRRLIQGRYPNSLDDLAGPQHEKNRWHGCTACEAAGSGQRRVLPESLADRIIWCINSTPHVPGNRSAGVEFQQTRPIFTGMTP